ncbi:MAG: hypothetical protein EOO02_07795 [Chitinophagaceae bacterium]|nr:MAG: hypothetical protein EOO02_07795 [Chitinophagaceae bacterium]
MDKQVEFFKVSNSNDDEYSTCLQIYLQSFPDNERQPTWLIKQRVNNGVATLYGGKRDKLTVAMGLLFNLKNSGFLLLDYFAVNAAGRGRGTGALMFDKIVALAKKENKQLVLEVEDPDFGANREERIRRISFYESKGAAIVPGIQYAQPAMLEGNEPNEMKLMIVPADPMPSAEEVRLLIIQLYKDLYNKKEEDPLLQKLLSQFNA